MHKIITKRYISEVVTEGIHKVKNESLEKILIKRNIPLEENISRERLIKNIFYHKINLCAVYEECKDYEFGINKSEILKLLDVDETILEKLLMEKIINKAYCKNGEDFFLLSDVYNTSKEKIQKFKIKNKKGKIKKNLDKDIKENHLKKALRRRIEDASENLESWKRLKAEENLIISIVTTGCNPEVDEILELGIINMNGDILYNERFNTNKRLSDETYGLKRIDKESLKDKKIFKESFVEVEEILKGKVLINYNSNFLRDMLIQVGMKENFKTICLMDKYMKYVHSKYVIRFKRALNMQNVEQQRHFDSKVMEECVETLNLISEVSRECKEKLGVLNNNLN